MPFEVGRQTATAVLGTVPKRVALAPNFEQQMLVGPAGFALCRSLIENCAASTCTGGKEL